MGPGPTPTVPALQTSSQDPMAKTRLLEGSLERLTPRSGSGATGKRTLGDPVFVSFACPWWQTGQRDRLARACPDEGAQRPGALPDRGWASSLTMPRPA